MANNSIIENYSNAPVIIAIIQIRYKKIIDFNNKTIREIGVALTKEYPKVNDSILQNFKLDREGETKFSLDSQEINGVRFTSNDEKNILVIANDKFTFEIHGKYPGWEAFILEYKKLWELFSPTLNNLEIIGISTRFINKFNLPLETKEINKYFTTFLQSNTGEHNINQFQTRYTSTEDNLVIHVGHALEPGIEKHLPYFLDIDVIYVGEISQDSNSLWNKFNDLREKKNYIFNDALTEEAKKLIK